MQVLSEALAGVLTLLATLSSVNGVASLRDVPAPQIYVEASLTEAEAPTPDTSAPIISLGKVTNMCLLQAASLSRKVSASQLVDEDSSRSWSVVPSAAATEATTTQILQVPKSPRLISQKDAGAHGITLKFRGSFDVVVFVLCSFIVVSVIILMMVFRLKLVGDKRFDEGGSGTVTQEVISFCPELVVPSECDFEVVLTNAAVVDGICDVLDPNGDVLLQAVPRHLEPWHVELRTVQGDLLAECRAVGQSKGTCEYHLHRADGEYFGKLVYEEALGNYSISLQNDSRFCFSCLPEQLIELSDASGQLLAYADAMSGTDKQTRMRLRVAPLADAGLALCGVFCIGHSRRVWRGV